MSVFTDSWIVAITCHMVRQRAMENWTVKGMLM